MQPSPAAEYPTTEPDRRPFNALIVVSILAAMLGLAARAYNLEYPRKLVFDEAYFPVMAKSYLRHQRFFDVHPPLGKLLIAIGVRIFGDRPLGWRIVPLCFGVANVLVMAAVAWRLFRDRAAVLIVVVLMSLEGIFVAYSRVGLMDGIMFFFAFLAYGLSIGPRSSRPYALGGAVGLAASVKWLGLGVLGPIAYGAALNGRLTPLLRSLVVALCMYGGVVMLGELLTGSPSPFVSALEWHARAAATQSSIYDLHPHSSPWWSWPLMDKPVLMLHDKEPSGAVHIISAVGNPLIWRTSSAAVLLTLCALARDWLGDKREEVLRSPLAGLMVGYASCMLPWIGVGRSLFLYHYMPAYGFALLILTFWAAHLWKRMPWIIVVFLAQCALISILFLPLNIGWRAVSESWGRRGY